MQTEKSPPAVQTLRGSEYVEIPLYLPDFTIENLRPVAFGRVQYTFDLVLGGVRILECKIVADVDGNPSFAVPPSIKEDYSKTYRATVTFDRDFRRVLFEHVMAVVQQPAPAPKPRKRIAQSVSPAWAEDQEAKFEAALAEL